MDFYGIYPCTVSNQDGRNLRIRNEQPDEKCTAFLKKLQYHNKEELDGHFFRDIERKNLGKVTIRLKKKESKDQLQTGFAFLSIHRQTGAGMLGMVFLDMIVPPIDRKSVV